jgi:drug/metabolite transporter (DMT)-like permease
MPVHLPPKACAKAVPVRKVASHWDGLWALSLGFCAIALSAVAYFMSADNVGASSILVGVAAIVAVTVHDAERQKTRGDD